jgi:hypothetical protein
MAMRRMCPFQYRNGLLLVLLVSFSTAIFALEEDDVKIFCLKYCISSADPEICVPECVVGVIDAVDNIGARYEISDGYL